MNENKIPTQENLIDYMEENNESDVEINGGHDIVENRREIMSGVYYIEEKPKKTKDQSSRRKFIEVNHEGYRVKFLILNNGELERSSISKPSSSTNTFILRTITARAEGALKIISYYNEKKS